MISNTKRTPALTLRALALTISLKILPLALLASIPTPRGLLGRGKRRAKLPTLANNKFSKINLLEELPKVRLATKDFLVETSGVEDQMLVFNHLDNLASRVKTLQTLHLKASHKLGQTTVKPSNSQIASNNLHSRTPMHNNGVTPDPKPSLPKTTLSTLLLLKPPKIKIGTKTSQLSSKTVSLSSTSFFINSSMRKIRARMKKALANLLARAMSQIIINSLLRLALVRVLLRILTISLRCLMLRLRALCLLKIKLLLLVV